MLINYTEMLAEYKKNMETNLRGFSGGPPPFETWVPYEGDDGKSMQALIDLAKEAGHEVVSVISENNLTAYLSERARVAQNWFEMNHPHVRIVGLKRNVLTLDYEETPYAYAPFHTFLISIEKKLNEELGETFDIQTLELSDKNKRKCGSRS